MTTYANAQSTYIFTPIEISDVSDDIELTTPFFAFVPTYLDGGNGIHSGVKEIMTNGLMEYLSLNDTNHQLLGLIGSGNKNFNAQYLLTARRYATHFNVPMIGEYELRGTQADIERIYQNILRRLTTSTTSASDTTQIQSNLRMLLFEQEQHGEAIVIDDDARYVSQILPADQHQFEHITNITTVTSPENIYTEQINLIANEHYWMCPIKKKSLTFK
ncbi:class Ib ribonucleoside-diphosphate reductase assembly flavoprotein NrdI [Weissella diestrammenae]|uniref:class Ib ribonucleoside-diphosphate reductase assembly flavoprotein NrdI n=1 Tax=Weissella diestrammenae TaxID=1162633 RepID=UPI0030B84A9E